MELSDLDPEQGQSLAAFEGGFISLGKSWPKHWARRNGRRAPGFKIGACGRPPGTCLPTRPVPKHRLLCDSVVLINFSQSELWSKFLSRHAGKIAAPAQVYDEICRGLVKHPFLREAAEAIESRTIERIDLSDHELAEFKRLLQFLGSGEAASIAMTRSRRWTMATDDMAVRRKCESLGLRLTGTVGILILACRDRKLTAPEADVALEKMIQAGFFSPVGTISGIL